MILVYLPRSIGWISAMSTSHSKYPKLFLLPFRSSESKRNLTISVHDLSSQKKEQLLIKNHRGTFLSYLSTWFLKGTPGDRFQQVDSSRTCLTLRPAPCATGPILCWWVRSQVACRFFLECYIVLYGYGSIPIHTIFRGMNIHLPAILMFTRGIGFWPIPYNVI